MRLSFCRRDVEAARRDLMRICARSARRWSRRRDAGHRTESRPPRTAAAASGAPHPGRDLRELRGPRRAALRRPVAELKIVRHALGDVPLVGFFAAGEIARHHLYGYTGVLTVFGGGVA